MVMVVVADGARTSDDRVGLFRLHARGECFASNVASLRLFEPGPCREFFTTLPPENAPAATKFDNTDLAPQLQVRVRATLERLEKFATVKAVQDSRSSRLTISGSSK